jgi:hypothetical protein
LFARGEAAALISRFLSLSRFFPLLLLWTINYYIRFLFFCKICNRQKEKKKKKRGGEKSFEEENSGRNFKIHGIEIPEEAEISRNKIDFLEPKCLGTRVGAGRRRKAYISVEAADERGWARAVDGCFSTEHAHALFLPFLLSVFSPIILRFVGDNPWRNKTKQVLQDP